MDRHQGSGCSVFMNGRTPTDAAGFLRLFFQLQMFDKLFAVLALRSVSA